MDKDFYLSNIIYFYNIDYLKDILIESDTFTNELETFFLSFYNQYLGNSNHENYNNIHSEIHDKLNILIKIALIKQFDPLSFDDSNLPTTSSSQPADNDEVSSDKITQFNNKLESMNISNEFYIFLNNIEN